MKSQGKKAGKRSGIKTAVDSSKSVTGDDCACSNCKQVFVDLPAKQTKTGCAAANAIAGFMRAALRRLVLMWQNSYAGRVFIRR